MPQSVGMFYRTQLIRPDAEVSNKALERTSSNTHRSVPIAIENLSSAYPRQASKTELLQSMEIVDLGYFLP